MFGLPTPTRDAEFAQFVTTATRSLGDRLLIVISGETANEDADLVTSITFTDASGIRVTQDVG